MALLLVLLVLAPLKALAESGFVPPRSLTVTMDRDYPPYSFATEDGRVQGIMRDLWDLWSAKTGVALHFLPVERTARTAPVDSGQADVVGYIVETGERMQQYLFAPEPPARLEMVIFFDQDITGISTLESLEGFTVGVMANGACAEWLAAHGVSRLRPYKDWDALYTAAARGEVNVFCSGKTTGLRRLYKMKLQKQFRASPPLYETAISWAVRKDRPELQAFVAAGFREITAAERRAIEERWIGAPVDSIWDSKALQVLAWLLLAAALIGLMLFTRNTGLRRQVTAKTHSLAQSERRYRALIESLPVGIFETDAEGGVVYANEVWLEMAGLSRAQTLGWGWVAAVHPDDRDALETARKAAFARGETFRHDYRLCRIAPQATGTSGIAAEGERRVTWVAVEAVPRFDADGSLTGYIGSVSDQTERRRHEAERRRLERQSEESKRLEALGQFAGGIAHDFNNFLGAILGYAQFIVEDARDADGAEHPAARYAQRIVTAGRRGRALVEQILIFTRRARLNKRRFHLSELLGEVEELLFVGAAGTAHFRFDNADPDAVVEADRDQLVQLLLNLCLNGQEAVRGQPHGVSTAIAAPVAAGGVSVQIRPTAFTPAVRAGFDAPRRDEEVAVWTDAEGTAFAIAGRYAPAIPYVSLIVADTGAGMDQPALAQAFTPSFATQDRAAGQGAGGQVASGQGAGGQGASGLGLAVVRGIVTAHGAALIARSRPGEGTCIEVALPRIAVGLSLRSDRSSAPETSSAATRARRILLVDDDADFCDMMRLLLERLGFEVVPYLRAREALADFRELTSTWDALITDQNMPEMTGLELLAAVKALRPDLPCLICSAYSETLTEAGLREAGALALISKPVDKDFLQATLDRALAPSAAQPGAQWVG